MLNISIAAEKIGHIGGFPVTNSLLTTWLVMIFLTSISLIISRRISQIPSRLQVIAEMLVGGFYAFFEKIVGKHIHKLFPLIMSLFIFIITANWIGLLPGVGTIGFWETETASESVVAAPVTAEPSAVSETNHASTAESAAEKKFVPILRGATADINTTLALAIVAVFAIQYFGFATAGIAYGTRFIDISNPINTFIGVLEIVSEVSKVISFAFRLFGNIFAGEVLLAVMAFLLPFIAPLPFLTLELFVGFIQALVFSMLTAVFLNVAIAHGEHAAHLAESKKH